MATTTAPAQTAKRTRAAVRAEEAALAAAQAALAAEEASLPPEETPEPAENIEPVAATIPPPAAPTPTPALPSRVRLIRPHGFIDATGNHYWPQGAIVTSAADIATLTDRGAPIAAA
jgi:Tfp pilus assembly protein PilX